MHGVERTLGKAHHTLLGFYFVGVKLRMSKPTRLHAQHAPILYATLSTAYGQARGIEPVMPDGVLPHVVEQCRLYLAKGDQYAFGLTILAHSPGEAAERLDTILAGLEAIGRRAPGNRVALGGNFSISTVTDQVNQRARQPHQKLVPLPLETIATQLDRLRHTTTITLRFRSPLRCARPKRSQREGHGYFDRDYFSPHVFLNRLVARLRALGVVTEQFRLGGSLPNARDNRLVWLDASYGPKKKRNAQGGAVGTVVLNQCNPAVNEALIWGQYAHVGGQTRFGFGRYEIDELKPNDLPAIIPNRTITLWELATSDAAMAVVATELELESGLLSEAVADIRSGHYTPDRHSQVPITNGTNTRVLSIPSRRDRALQRLVLDQISPPIDLFLEESSLAYRHGLGRQRAARRIREAYRKGFRWGVKADFMAFFDSVDHDELSARVKAYLADDFLADLIMQWVQKGAPSTGKGLPTGAPLSPLLANILLDQFDEQVSLRNGFLIRYADDFLILFEDESQAHETYQLAYDQAAALKLALNQDKTQMIDLREPFTFLGYQFYYRDEWETMPTSEPALLDDIGWHDSAKESPRKATETRLRGESVLAPRAPQATLIWGPGVKRLRTQGNQLLGFYGDSRPPARTAMERIRDLVLLGTPSIDQTAMSRLMCHGVTVFLADEVGRVVSTLAPEEQLEDAAAIRAQAKLQSDDAQRLTLARKLVAAKLVNHGALSDAYQGRDKDYRTGRELRDLAEKASEADCVEALLGFEGAGAKLWYGVLPRRLPRSFTFDRRVAPSATDPVNVMLNIGHTMVYRLMVLIIRQAGLVPSLGVLHRMKQGHAALASDLQEPWRHLVERSVLETLQRIRPSDFALTDHPDFPLRVSNRASRELTAKIHRTLSVSCQGKGQSTAKPYRYQMQSMVRSLKGWLTDPDRSLEVFQHP